MSAPGGISPDPTDPAGDDVVEVGDDAQGARPAEHPAEIEVPEERNILQQVVRTVLKAGLMFIAVCAAVKGGSANVEQRNKRPGTSSTRRASELRAALLVPTEDYTRVLHLPCACS